MLIIHLYRRVNIYCQITKRKYTASKVIRFALIKEKSMSDIRETNMVYGNLKYKQKNFNLKLEEVMELLVMIGLHLIVINL